MSNLQISDLIEIQPYMYDDEGESDPDFQLNIAKLKEFEELRATVNDQIPTERGDFFPHQQFVSLFMSIYHRLLIWHTTGSGKSGVIVAACEEFLRQRKDMGSITLSSFGE